MTLNKRTAIRRFLQLHLGWCLGALLFLLFCLDLRYTQILRSADHWLLDRMLRQQALAYQADPDIVVIDIDDQSMREMQEIAGLWVWRREIHASLVQALDEFKPRALLFDLNFHEKDKAHQQSDAFLSEQLCASPWIFLQTLQIRDREPYQLNPAILQQALALPETSPTDFQTQLQLPLAINPACWRLGLVNGINDADGVMRRSLLKLSVDGVALPSLSARVIQSLKLPLPDSQDFYLRWSARAHLHLSYGQLYKILTEQRHELSKQQWQDLQSLLQNKLIVVGSSASGAFDYHLTPMSPAYPGVDILALALDNLKNQRTILPLPQTWGVLLALLLIFAVNLAFARGMAILHIALVLFLASVCGIGLSYYLLQQDRILWGTSPLIVGGLNYFTVAMLAYLRERRSRDRAVSLFARFLNPAIVKTIVDQGASVESLSGQQKQITVLFSDIRGFTQLSEKRSAVEVVRLLNRYYEMQVEIIWRHGGTLDKFIGDCIMAFWGAPVDDADQVNRAIACALEMELGLQEFKRELTQQLLLPDFDIGIGIHTGDAVVGFIGAARKLDYTAIGDTVNLASRVEGLTKGVARILVTREAQELADSYAYEFTPHGCFQVKGRDAPVELFQPKRKVEC